MNFVEKFQYVFEESKMLGKRISHQFLHCLNKKVTRFYINFKLTKKL